MDATWTSRWDLSFDDPATEREFRRYHEMTSVPVIREASLGALFIWGGIHSAVAAFAPQHLFIGSLLLGALYPVVLANLLLASRPRTPERCHLLQHLVLFAHTMSFMIAIGMGQLRMRIDVLGLVGLVSMLYQVASVYRHRASQVLLLLLAGGGAYLAALVYLGYRGELAEDLRWVGPLMVGVTVLQSFLVARGGERALRETFLMDQLIEAQKQQILAEKARSEELLLNVLPSSIAAVLRDRPGIIAEEQPEASVLFADLAGFTSMSAGMTAAQVVEVLNEVFTEFDRLVDKHGLEKIKTIGDCYMVAAGVPSARHDHAIVMVRLALEMRDLVASREFAGRKLSFRFGVNSGPVVAGVIGRRKFIYDLWGDTVNVASRMESNGHAGVVQVSAETRGRVDGAFVCEPRGKVHMKGKGEMDVFHVVGKRVAVV
ncbi:MAG: adenylate/guanylate cyclase domain-containing protein [Deltaproteobacteria bacterium]|nr:adenylate/guanylate cyclase domain-containing protein [Deltaproteobacteria bacterium]